MNDATNMTILYDGTVRLSDSGVAIASGSIDVSTDTRFLEETILVAIAHKLLET